MMRNIDRKNAEKWGESDARVSDFFVGKKTLAKCKHCNII